MTRTQTTCGFSDCHCPVDGDSEIAPFCSAYCATADREKASGACSCRHEACLRAGQAMDSLVDAEVKTSIGGP
jgi:hypothetical protein